MKIEKKHIIIAIVLAVAVYLLWKKGVFSKSTSSGSNDDGSNAGSSSGVDLDYILTHITFNSAERAKIEEVRKQVEASNIWKQSIQAKANKNGLSFDQQLCCDALWLLYINNGKWTNDRGWKLSADVKAL